MLLDCLNLLLSCLLILPDCSTWIRRFTLIDINLPSPLIQSFTKDLLSVLPRERLPEWIVLHIAVSGGSV
jgi:hypothetical protein